MPFYIGCCCGSGGSGGSGSGSGGTPEPYTCTNNAVIPAFMTFTVDGFSSCIVSDCLTEVISQVPWEDGTYTLTRFTNEEMTGDCVGDDNCYACYRLGTLTLEDVAVLHGITLGTTCLSFSDTPVCFDSYGLGGFDYIKTTVCGGDTIDSYLALNVCGNFSPTGGTADLSLLWVHVVNDTTMYINIGGTVTTNVWYSNSDDCATPGGGSCCNLGGTSLGACGGLINFSFGAGPSYSDTINTTCCNDFDVTLAAVV